jgi:hypothetical protein
MNFNDPITSEYVLLMVDREKPTAARALNTWVGQEFPLPREAGRFVVIFTMDTKGDPRYLHSIDCVDSLDDAIARMIDAQEFITRHSGISGLPYVPDLYLLDCRFLLAEVDQIKVDSIINENAAKVLQSQTCSGIA